jgi:hypothetical protein
MRPQKRARESKNRHDDMAPSPVMIAASSSSSPSQSARALQHALRGILRGGNHQSFARLQSELLALVETTSSSASMPDRPNDDMEETNHNNYNNTAAAAAAVWFEPDPVTGWTFLHYCASTDDLPSRHWEWLLQHCPVVVVDDRTAATTTPSPLVALETALGETVVDIFLQHRLGQLKWQSDTSKARAARLVQVLEGRDRTVMAAAVWPPPSSGTSTTVADAELRLFHVAVQEEEDNAAWSDDAGYLSTAFHEDEKVRTVRTFLRDFYLLLQKSLHHKDGDDPKTPKTCFDWRTALARIGPSVPAIVADWIELYLEQQQTVEQSSRSKQRALHILCQTKPRVAHYRSRHDHPPPLLSLCLTERGANTVIPETGLWPIEQALQSGWSFASMYELWKQTTMMTNSSSSLSSSRLPLCAYAAMVQDDDDERALQVLAQMCHGGPFPVYGWHMALDATRHEGMAAARREIDRQRLTCIYECLRAAPPSLLSSSWRRMRRDEAKAALPGQPGTAARPEPV